jgi:dTDP-4-amino-4,6-dideoxy-D-galactose acyltransferase
MIIEELEWDSNFFKRKMGILKHIPSNQLSLKRSLEDAKNKGFFHIHCRLDASEIEKIQLLERCGFYISDFGVTWAINLLEKEISFKPLSVTLPEVRIATIDDLLEVKKIITNGLFYTSRFYKDPFFKKSEADALYEAWVENSIKGIVADIVFFIKDSGFITCRQLDKDNGVISLVGVVPSKRNRGIGSLLIKKALEWFCVQKVSRVSVRTQSYNIPAMNFYRRLGFSIKSSDITMAIILKEEGQ